MSGLSPDEQLRTLRAAEGNPGLLALAAIDMAYPDLAEGDRNALRTALAACAIPHWFSPVMLQQVLEVDRATADTYWERLTKLQVVERFVARGPDAANVHEASRNALRRHLHAVDRGRLMAVSGRVVSYLDGADDVASRIERIYHLLLVDPETAAHELERAGGDWLKDVDARKAEAIDHALEELLEEGFLTGRAEVRARMTIAMRQVGRGAFSAVDDADEFLNAGRSFDDPFLIADAYAMKAAQHIAALDWAAARPVAMQAREIWKQALVDDPADSINQSELAGILEVTSKVAKQLGRFEEAADAIAEALAIREQLVAQEPRHVGHRREMAAALTDVARLSSEFGSAREAWAYYRRAIELLAELRAEHPDHHDIQFDLISALIAVAGLEADHGDAGAAIERYDQAAVLLTELVEIDPSQLLWRLNLGVAWMALSSLQFSAGELDAARSAVEEALGIFEELNALESNPLYRSALAPTYRLAGAIAAARNEPDAAALAFQKAESLDDVEADD